MRKGFGIAGAVLLGAIGTIGVHAQVAEVFQPHEKMSFFITSVGSGQGGNLGGLQGADQLCRDRAAAAGAPSRNWRAFLSTSPHDGQPGVDARDRIGSGPWYNAKGEEVGVNVRDLFRPGSPINKETALTERGETVGGRGDTPNRHDILTGSTVDGRAYGDANCSNWTSDGAEVARVGHFDRTGGGEIPTSWVSAHTSRSCSQPDLEATGGAGLIYCFAAD